MALKILQILKKIAANNNDYKNTNSNNRAPVLLKCVRRLLTTSFLLSSLVAIRVCFKKWVLSAIYRCILIQREAFVVTVSANKTSNKPRSGVEEGSVASWLIGFASMNTQIFHFMKCIWPSSYLYVKTLNWRAHRIIIGC